MFFKVVILPDAEESFLKLDRAIQQRISDKIDWMSEHAGEIIHHPLTSLPDDLKGLCRIRVGDYLDKNNNYKIICCKSTQKEINIY